MMVSFHKGLEFFFENKGHCKKSLTIHQLHIISILTSLNLCSQGAHHAIVDSVA